MAYQPKSYRKFLVGAVSTAVVASSFAGVAGAASYSDVNSKYQEAVDFVVSKGIVGTSATTFGTYENIKRVDAAVFVAKVLGLNTTSAPNAGFTDVPARAQGAVNALKAAGITSGKSATTFGAQDYITRGELAVWIQKGFGLEAGYQNLAFTDVPSQYATAVNALVSNNVTSGTSATTFGTYENAKRGDFAVFLLKASKAKDIVPPVVKPASAVTIKADNKGNNLINGDQKTYTVKVTNPVAPDKGVAGVKVNVTFKENLNTNGKPQNNIYVTNNDNSTTVPFQANDSTQQVVEVTTNYAGEATFTVSGANGSVTPIAFLDGSNQEWDTKGGIKFGTQDGRFDQKYEYYAQADTLTFAPAKYTIDVVGERDKFAAITVDTNKNGTIEGAEFNGRKYNITVKKPDGTPYVGNVNVGVLELEDTNNSNDLTDAYIVGAAKQEAIIVKTDKDGKASFRIASPTANDAATPVVWINHSYSNNPTGTDRLDDNDSQSKNVEYTNFQKPYVANGTAGASLKVTSQVANGKGFNLSLLNQSGNPFLPSWGTIDDLDARVTFTIKNDGPSAVFVNTKWLGDVRATAGRDYSYDKDNGRFLIASGGQITIAGNITDNEWFGGDDADYLVQVWSTGGDAKVTVSGSAVVDSKVDPRSQSVAVNAGPVTETVTGLFGGTVLNTVETKDSADVGTDPDQLVLTFSEDVSGFEKADFQLLVDNGTYVTPSKVEYAVKSDDINSNVKNQLVLTFTDRDITKANTLSYDGTRGDSAIVLVDKYGSVIRAFEKTGL